MDINWTGIVCAVIEFAITVLFAQVWTKYVKPWLEDHHLTEAAIVAVNAAEAVYGRYNGDEKLTYALKYLKNKGFDIDAEDVLNAIKAAWQELDLAQIISGIKKV